MSGPDKTMNDIADKHTKSRRCKSVEEEGCGKRKSVDEFPDTKWRNGWCTLCQNARNKSRSDKRYPPTGGTTGIRVKSYDMTGFSNHLDRLFFCRVPMVKMAAEIREARRAACS